MNKQSNRGEDFGRDEATMARLLRLAGPRSRIPPEIESRVYERVKREWKVSSQLPESARVYKRVRREWTRMPSVAGGRRWLLPLAVAASVVLAITVVLRPAPPPAVTIPIASVVKVIGDQEVRDLPSLGDTVLPGDTLTTREGQGISLLLARNESLRLDENTTVILTARDRLRLVRGRVYADTGEFIYRDGGIIVETSMGSVADVGTQFAVSVDDVRLDVAVREGRVDIENSKKFVAVAGERMTLTPQDGAVFGALAPHDAYWDWASALAPAYDIENKSLLDVLRWAARETGRELVFEDADLRMSAMRAEVHGPISDLEPLEALESVLTTTTFSYRIDARSIVIER
ncbi:MAG: FecR domain-containing protein [Woeseia sp.]